MYRFNEITIPADNGIIFLCGTKYREKSQFDKRNVLKEYLNSKFPKLKVLILEEHFVFGNRVGYLSYDDIFLKNLNDIEEMTAAFSNGIIVIHDSISTGAELAAFATNEYLEDKICVLEPDSTGIEEQKISAFLEYAYFGEDSKIERIIYYPEVYSYIISERHIEKRTNFPGNKITPILGKKINDFVDKCNRELHIHYEKMICKKVNNNKGVISYTIEDDKILVYVSGQVILYQVIGLLIESEFRKELRLLKKLYNHIDYLTQTYKAILKDTIEEKVMDNVKDISVVVKETNREIRNVIAFSLYMLQAFDMIVIESKKGLNRISFKNSYDENIINVKGIIGIYKDDLMELLDE